MRLLLPLLAVFILFTACKEGWSDENKQAYLSTCKDQLGLTGAQSDKYCQCMLDVTMQHYKTIDEVIANKDSVAINAARKTCIVQASDE